MSLFRLCTSGQLGRRKELWGGGVDWSRGPRTGQRQRHRPVGEWHFPEERVRGLDAQAKRRIPAFVEAMLSIETKHTGSRHVKSSADLNGPAGVNPRVARIGFLSSPTTASRFTGAYIA